MGDHDDYAWRPAPAVQEYLDEFKRRTEEALGPLGNTSSSYLPGAPAEPLPSNVIPFRPRRKR